MEMTRRDILNGLRLLTHGRRLATSAFCTGQVGPETATGPATQLSPIRARMGSLRQALSADGKATPRLQRILAREWATMPAPVARRARAWFGETGLLYLQRYPESSRACAGSEDDGPRERVPDRGPGTPMGISAR